MLIAILTYQDGKKCYLLTLDGTLLFYARDVDEKEAFAMSQKAGATLVNRTLTK